MQLHRRIRTLRIKKGLTGMELARRAGVSPSYVSLIEHGEKIPSEGVAVRLARALEEREDLYRVWAVLSRLDARTREAMLRVSRDGGLARPRIDGGPDGEPRAQSVGVPLLAPGASPARAELDGDEVETVVTVDRRLLGDAPADALVALRVDELNGRRVRSWLRPEDLAIVHCAPDALAEGRIHALRLPGEGLVLARATLSASQLLLLADPSDEGPPRALPLDDERPLGEALFGTVVASIHRWS